MRILVVPSDATVLVDGKHLTHPNMDALGLDTKLDPLRPKVRLHTAELDDGAPAARLQWIVETTWITREQFMELFGDAVADNESFFIQLEAENENWQREDEAQTQNIAERENAAFDANGTK